jgi:hypothetical protein
MLKLYSLFIPAVILFSFGGCKKSNEYPIEPVITFKAITLVKDNQGLDDQVIIEITFTDGDGDIGIDSSEIGVAPFTGQYLYNIYFQVYADSTGNGLVHWSSFDEGGQVPVITPEGNTKSIRGEIRKDFIYLPNHMTNLPIRYEVYIYDRAFHRSNTVTTSTIVINSQ